MPATRMLQTSTNGRYVPLASLNRPRISAERNSSASRPHLRHGRGRKEIDAQHQRPDPAQVTERGGQFAQVFSGPDLPGVARAAAQAGAAARWTQVALDSGIAAPPTCRRPAGLACRRLRAGNNYAHGRGSALALGGDGRARLWASCLGHHLREGFAPTNTPRPRAGMDNASLTALEQAASPPSCPASPSARNCLRRSHDADAGQRRRCRARVPAPAGARPGRTRLPTFNISQ